MGNLLVRKMGGVDLFRQEENKVPGHESQKIEMCAAWISGRRRGAISESAVCLLIWHIARYCSSNSKRV